MSVEPTDTTPKSSEPTDLGKDSFSTQLRQRLEVFSRKVWLDFSADMGILLSTGFACLILGFTAFGGLFSDLYLLLSPPKSISNEVTIVSIDPKSLAMWDSEDSSPDVTPRDLLAQLITTVSHAGANVVVLDIMLDSSTQHDEALATAIREHGMVLSAEQIQVNEPHSMTYFSVGITPELQAQTVVDNHRTLNGVSANLYLEEPILYNGNLIARGAPLLMVHDRVQTSGEWPSNVMQHPNIDNTLTPSIGLAAAWLHRNRLLDASVTYEMLLADLQAVCEVQRAGLVCGSKSLPGLPDFEYRLDRTFYLNFLGPETRDPLPVIQASTLLTLEAERAQWLSFGLAEKDLPEHIRDSALPSEVLDQLKDKVVVIGRVDKFGEEGADRYPTPYSFPFFTRNDMAGVRIQAQLIENILTNRHFSRVHWIFELLFTVVCTWLTILMYTRTSKYLQAVLWLGSTAFLIALGTLLFIVTDGIVLELGLCITMSLLTLIVCNIYEGAEG